LIARSTALWSQAGGGELPRALLNFAKRALP
jgi:hypothetical protein